MTTDLFAELKERELVHQTTTPELGELLRKGRVTAYIGFDPTARSLHVGSLLPAVALARLQRAGHRPIAVVGGATGLIGDPSGKEGERGMLSAEEVEAHVQGLRSQLAHFVDFDDDALLVNNADWLCEVALIDFLRDIGKHFTVNQMVVRDSVRPRLEDPDRSISYTEFSYMLLQAYDFLVLQQRYGCTLQLGGSDQWGNIVSGCDLIRRKTGIVAHGLTMPLLTKSDGKKFGKSEQGNVWLDPELTSPYEFYQFWLNTDDADVGRCLRYFTFLPMDRIRELDGAVRTAPQEREAQRTLAAEVTGLVHGTEAVTRAERTTAVLFRGGDWHELSARELSEAFAHSPRSELPRAGLGTPAAHLAVVVAEAGLCPSRGQARQAIQSGALYVNNVRVSDPQHVLTAADLLAERFIVLRRGKKAYHVVVVGDA